MHTEEIKGGSFLLFYTMATGMMENSWMLKEKSNSIHNRREAAVTTHVYGSLIKNGKVNNRLKIS